MKSIKELRENLERARAEYLVAENPNSAELGFFIRAKNEYQHACTGIVESLIACKCETSALDIINLELWK